MTFRRVLLATAATALVVAAAAPVAEAGDLEASVKVAEGDKSGPYHGFLQNVNVKLGKTKTLWWRVKGKGNTETLDLNFSDDGSSSMLENFKVRWFKHGEDKTEEIQGEGKPFHLDPGESKYFESRVKRIDPGDGFCIEGGLAFDMFNSAGTFAGVATECAT